MIEVGQKFICVKYCYVLSDIKGDIGYNEGDIIQITRVYPKGPLVISGSLAYSCRFLNRKNVNLSLIIIDNEEIKNYFITFAEWREKQIKSIIDG